MSATTLSDPRTPSPDRNITFVSTRNFVNSPSSDYYSDVAGSAASSPDLSKAHGRSQSFQAKLMRHRISMHAALSGFDARRGPESYHDMVEDSREHETGLGLLDFEEDAGHCDDLETQMRRADCSTDSDDNSSAYEHESQRSTDIFTKSSKPSTSTLDDYDMASSSVSVTTTDPFVEKVTTNQNPTVEAYAEHLEAVVARISRVKEQLTDRLEEVRNTNDEMLGKYESACDEALQLRSENESLRRDISFNHTELLFLKLQLKAVEMTIDPDADDADETGRTFKHSVSKSLSEGIERCKKDWGEISLKDQARRAKYGLAVAPRYPVDTSLKLEARGLNPDRLIQFSPSRPTKIPRRVLSMSRPINGFRSLTAPATSTRPLTPPDTATDESDESGNDVFSGDAALDSGIIVESDADLKNIGNKAHTEGPVASSKAYVEGSSPSPHHPGKQASTTNCTESDVVETSSSQSREQTSGKTPWQELWDGLAALAGMSGIEE